MNSIVSLLILVIVSSLSACASGGMGNYGYWVNEKPFKGTREATKFNTHPYWQCVSNRMWTHNTECD